MTLVRNAKAEEILANAGKLNAEAEATLILARAEAALKEAQAELAKADAEYRKAEAKSEEARTKLLLLDAELKQVQIDLAKVLLDEERVELQRKEAELLKFKAEYEAAIAQAEAQKVYWQYQKELMDKRMEIALVAAQTQLLEAQAALVAAQEALNQAIRDAEQAEHDAEIQANEQAAQEREALRVKVAQLFVKYYNAAALLLDLEHDIIHEEMLIAKAEADIITETELKGEMIEYNNREIARLQKVVEYLETLVDADPEDIKDQLTDLFIQVDQQYVVMMDALAAYAAVYNQMWDNAPNEAGDSPNLVTYTYTEKFFNPDTDPVDVDDDGYYDAYWPELSNLNPDYFEKGITYDEVGDPIKYEDAGIVYLVDDDEVYHYFWLEEEYDFASGAWSLTKLEELYSYYWGGPAVGLKEYQERYPELGEGISYDEREPYIMVDKYEFFPLEINRDGYQAYVDYENDITEMERQAEIDDVNEYCDYYAAAYTGLKERYEAFLAEYSVPIEKMDKKVDETIDNFMTEWEKVVGLYEDFAADYNAYIKKYEIDNSVERTEALVAYQKAYAAWQELIAARPDFESDMVTPAATALFATIAAGLLEKEKEMFYANETLADPGYFEIPGGEKINDYNEWQSQLAAAKVLAGFVEYAYNAYKKALDDAQTAFNLAEKTYNTTKEAYDKALDTYWKALQNDADATAAWLAAGMPSSGSIKDAMDSADAALTAATTAKNAEFDNLYGSTGDGTVDGALYDYNTAKAALDAAKKDMYGADGTGKTEGAVYDLNNAKEIVETIANLPKVTFDDGLAELNQIIADAEAEYNEIKAKADAYDAKIADAEKAKDDAFAAWKKVAGDDTEFAALDKKYNDWVDAASKLGNPVMEMLRNYGVISDIDYGYTDDSILPWIVDEYEAGEFYYWAQLLYSYDVYDPSFDMEAYIEDLLYEALYEYFSDYLPSVAWDFFDNEWTYGAFDDETLTWDWEIEADNYIQHATQSPLGILFTAKLMNGELYDEDGKWDNAYTEYSYYYTIDDFAELAEYFDVDLRQSYLEGVNAYYDLELAINNLVMVELDDILQYEATYKAAIEELNNLAQQLPELEIKAWQEYNAYEELCAQIEYTYVVTYSDAQALADAIKQYKQDIADLEEENADWSAITEMEHALTKLKGIYELDLEEYELAKVLVADYKADYEAALAELKGE